MLAALTGAAAASTVYLWAWLAGVTALAVDKEIPPRRRLAVRCGLGILWLAIPAVIAMLIFRGLLNVSAGDASATPGTDLNADQARQIRPFSFVAAIFEAPGLAALVGLRWVAVTDSRWRGTGQDRIGLLHRLQSEGRRLLTVLGLFLTLLVVVTGMRRNALLAYYENHQMSLDFPAEAVLVYGLVFAVVLAVFYLIAAGGIDHRAASIVDDYAPLPSPEDDRLPDLLKRRADVGALTGAAGASWATFQTTVVIAAPLVTGLIGAATG
jgi:hypothetical protein